MTKNDQKFFTEAMKKFEDVKVPDIPLMLLNSPAVRKELSRNPTRRIIIKPPEK